jgi:hypothetical protein
MEFLPSVEDMGTYLINADAGLRAVLTGNMFGEVKVEWRRNSDPPDDKQADDLRYVLGVGWHF